MLATLYVGGVSFARPLQTLCLRVSVGKLDPNESLQAVSILHTSPRAAGVYSFSESPSSPGRGNAMPRSHRANPRGSSNRRNGIGGDSGKENNGNAEHDRSSNNEDCAAWVRSNNWHGSTESSPRRPAKGGGLRPEAYASLSDDSFTSQHCSGGVLGGGGRWDENRQRTAVEVNPGCSMSSTFFVRSKQWGRRHPERTEFRLGETDSSVVLDVCRLAVAGGKRARLTASSERQRVGQRAAGGRTSSGLDFVAGTSNVQWLQHQDRCTTTSGYGDSGRHHRNAASALSPAVAAGSSPGLVEGQGVGQDSPARLPENCSFLSLPDTVATLAGNDCAGSETLYVPHPQSKLRPDGDPRLLQPRGVPRWFSTAEGAETTPASHHSGLSAAEKGGALEVAINTMTSAALATRTDNNVPAPAATSAVAPPAASSTGVPQPLSVVAVWSRGSPPQTTPPRAKSGSPPSAGIRYSSTEICCSGAGKVGGGHAVGRERGFRPNSPRSEELVCRQSAAAEKFSMRPLGDPGPVPRWV